MARLSLALLVGATAPFADATVFTPGLQCYDKKIGNPAVTAWTDSISGDTCNTLEGTTPPGDKCTAQENTRNVYVAGEACCQCGGGSNPYYVELLGSPRCVNDGKQKGLGDHVLTFATQAECCAALPPREARACKNPTTKVYPNFELGRCESAATRPPRLFPTCHVSATGVPEYISQLFLEQSARLPASSASFCCLRLYDGLPDAAKRCQKEPGTWYWANTMGCVRSDNVADHPVVYASARAVSDPGTCEVDHFRLQPRFLCDAYTCLTGVKKSNPEKIHCGSVAGDCTNALCCDATCDHTGVNAVKSCGDGFIPKLTGDLPPICGDGTLEGCLTVYHEQCCDVTCYAFNCPAGQELIAHADNTVCTRNNPSVNTACSAGTCCTHTCAALPTCGANKVVTPSLVADHSTVDYLAFPSGGRNRYYRYSKVWPHRVGSFIGAYGTRAFALRFDVPSGEWKRVSYSGGHVQSIGWLDVFPNGKTAVTGGRDDVIKVWKITESGQWDELASYGVQEPNLPVAGRSSNKDVRLVALPDNRHILSIGYNDVTRPGVDMWDTQEKDETKARVRVFTFGPTDPYIRATSTIVLLPKNARYDFTGIGGAKSNPAQSYFAIHAYTDTNNRYFIYVVSIETGTLIARISTFDAGSTGKNVPELDVLADGRLVVPESYDRVRVYGLNGVIDKEYREYGASQATTETKTGTPSPPALVINRFTTVSTLQYGNRFVTGDRGGNVYLWDADTGPVRKFIAREHPASPNTFIPVESYVLGILMTPQGWHPTEPGSHVITAHNRNGAIASIEQLTTITSVYPQPGCGGACTAAQCCATTCSGWTCNNAAGWENKANKNAVICAGGTCTNNVCCDPRCDHPLVCTAGFVKAASILVHPVVCNSDPTSDPALCNKKVCCDAVCSHTDVPACTKVNGYKTTTSPAAITCSTTTGVGGESDPTACTNARCCDILCSHPMVTITCSVVAPPAEAGFVNPSTSTDEIACQESSPAFAANPNLCVRNECCDMLCIHDGVATCQNGYKSPGVGPATLTCSTATSLNTAKTSDCTNAVCCDLTCAHASSFGGASAAPPTTKTCENVATGFITPTAGLANLVCSTATQGNPSKESECLDEHECCDIRCDHTSTTMCSPATHSKDPVVPRNTITCSEAKDSGPSKFSDCSRDRCCDLLCSLGFGDGSTQCNMASTGRGAPAAGTANIICSSATVPDGADPTKCSLTMTNAETCCDAACNAQGVAVCQLPTPAPPSGFLAPVAVPFQAQLICATASTGTPATPGDGVTGTCTSFQCCDVLCSQGWEDSTGTDGAKTNCAGLTPNVNANKVCSSPALGFGGVIIPSSIVNCKAHAATFCCTA